MPVQSPDHDSAQSKYSSTFSSPFTPISPIILHQFLKPVFQRNSWRKWTAFSLAASSSYPLHPPKQGSPSSHVWKWIPPGFQPLSFLPAFVPVALLPSSVPFGVAWNCWHDFILILLHIFPILGTFKQRNTRLVKEQKLPLQPALGLFSKQQCIWRLLCAQHWRASVVTKIWREQTGCGKTCRGGMCCLHWRDSESWEKRFVAAHTCETHTEQEVPHLWDTTPHPIGKSGFVWQGFRISRGYVQSDKVIPASSFAMSPALMKILV